MSRSAVKSVQDFAFQSDFSPPAPPSEPAGPDTVSVTPSELAELLANARTEGMLAANTTHDRDTTARLQATSEQLRAALTALLQLAECLEDTPFSGDTKTDAQQFLTAACQHIVDGQGDLFAQE